MTFFFTVEFILDFLFEEKNNNFSFSFLLFSRGNGFWIDLRITVMVSLVLECKYIPVTKKKIEN